VQSGAAAVDLLGRDGRLDRMLELHRELVAFLRDLWGAGKVAAEVRLAALAIGHVGTALRTASPARRLELLEVVEQLHRAAAAVWGEGSTLAPPTLEGRAWEARASAERERSRWAAGEDVPLDALVSSWSEVADRFERRSEPYEVARARARLAEVLIAAGDAAAAEVLQSARETARALGAAPLVEHLEHLAPRPVVTTLTPREAEVLHLVAEGRSNGEIGRALFISTKTASVHVSNILAKLGAASRGEAVALARSAGVLPD
jgi:DNA-binding CsgD family transcriptional regulator